MVAQHTDRTTYVAWVLWLIGMSQTSIARVLLKRRKQIAGIVDRSPYAKRSAMSDGERQRAVDELLAVRFGEDGQPIDGGVLDPVPMKIIPLRGMQRKRRAS
jgi:hypothetical protein